MACHYGFNTLDIFDENVIFNTINEKTEGIIEHKDKIQDALKGINTIYT